MKDHSRNKTTLQTNPTNPNVLDYGVPDRQGPSRFAWAARLVALLMAVGLIMIGWRITRKLSESGSFTMATPPWPATAPSDITEFYHTAMTPRLDEALQRNQQAVDRAIASLHERFNAHRAGVKPFADDVSGWGTRFGVIGSFASDFWDQHWHGSPNANRVGDYIQEKFRFHVLSEQSLQEDLDEVLKQFREDMEASRNQLFAEIKLPLHGSHSPITLDENGWDRLRMDITQRAQRLNATTPRDSVVTGLAAVAGGWIGSEATEAIVAQILARVGTAAAVEAGETAAATGGSAMVGGTATGGGVGSFGGPAGTVIGVGVGLAIGAAIDWWMSDRFEARLTDQCNEFLDKVERQIVDGSAQSPGLRSSFEQAVKLADERQRRAIIDALLEAPK